MYQVTVDATERASIPLDKLPDYIFNLTARLESLESALQNIDHNPSVEVFCGVPQAGKITNLSHSRIYALCKEKKLPHYKQNGKLLFLPSELIAYIRKGRKEVAL